jgi:hypothetical protein
MSRKGWLFCLGLAAALAFGCGVGDQTDTDSPIILFVSPENGDTVFGEVHLRVDALDAFGVSKVSFYVSTRLIAEDGFAPFEAFWLTNDLADGPYTLRAEGVDASGNKGSDEIRVTVENSTR